MLSTRSMLRRGSVGAVLAVGATFGLAGVAAAEEPDFFFPAGQACTFQLDVYVSGDSPDTREFTDKDGNVVRTIQSGKGVALTLVNHATGASLALPANGFTTQTTVHPDGSSTVVITGHTILILFPTDVPAGPSTRLHIGRVEFNVDTNAVSTVTSTSGQQVDICAALSA